MIVIRLDRLDAFAERYPDSLSALLAWRQTVEASIWKNPAQVRQTYGATDIAVQVKSGRRVAVFNIRGNKYRLIASINYPVEVVNVLFVLTHREYDTNRWKEQL